MAKGTKPATDKVQILELIGLLAALGFMHSVTTTAHHRLLPGGALDAPPLLFLVVPLLIVGYYWNKRKFSLRVINAVTLVILAVSAYFWLFALRANSQ